MGVEIRESLGWYNGQVIADAEGWKLSFYLAGLDLRYNGEFFVLAPDRVEEFASDLARAYSRYEAIKAALPAGTSGSERVGAFAVNVRDDILDGVFLKSWHNRVSSREDLSVVTDRLAHAMRRGPELVEAARKLG